ncbi:MAG: hypothetical protein P4M07_11010, partial [Xanthobacteraceae bacterium]|nr:hypothetical protein [Xanthobacteraceae bacterium]
LAAKNQASWYCSSWRGLQSDASTPDDSRLITPETTPPSIPTNSATAPRDERRTTQFQTGVSGGRQTGIAFQPVQNEFRVLLGQRTNHSRRFIRRSVVDHNHAAGSMCLGANGCNGLRDEFRGIEGGDDDVNPFVKGTPNHRKSLCATGIASWSISMSQ